MRSERLDDQDLRGNAAATDDDVFRADAEEQLAALLAARSRQRHAEAIAGEATVANRAAEEVHRRRSDESTDELRRRVVVDLHRCPDLLDRTVAHHRDPLAETHGFDLIVRHVHRRALQLLVQALQIGACLKPEERIEVGERLVHEQEVGVHHERARDRDPLALPARELRRIPIEESLELQQARSFLDAAADLLASHLAHAQAEADVRAHGHVREHRVALEHHRRCARAAAAR